MSDPEKKKKRVKAKNEEANQKGKDLYVGMIICTNARWETSGVRAAAQKTAAN